MNTLEKYDSEDFDWIELVKMLWNGKWKIVAITFLTFIMGVGVTILKPAVYHASTSILPAQNSEFVKYIPLNQILIASNLNVSEERPYGYSIDTQSIFQMVIVEFNDYTEIIDALKSEAFVQSSIKGLNEGEERRKLYGFAKSFKLTAPAKDKVYWMISYEWPDAEAGQRILTNAMNSVLENVRTKIANSISGLAASINDRNARQIAILQNKLSVITKISNERIAKRVQFLSEQAAIAKVLGIEVNQMDLDMLSRSQSNSVSVNINSNEVPYYLRGYKAIDTENRLLSDRSEKLRGLMSDGYIETKEKLAELQSDLLSMQLSSNLGVLESDNPLKWVKYDLKLADLKTKNNPIVYLALSVVLGGIIGGFYVLISEAIRKRNCNPPQIDRV